MVTVISELVELYGDDLVIIEGECHGADIMARVICQEAGIAFDPYPAEWSKYAKAAGPIRNKEMLDKGKPHEVIAFHETIDKSRGTVNMMKQAIKAGLPVRLVK